MRSMQLFPDRLARRRGVAVLTATLVCAGISLADRFPPDPVEELRQALRPPALGRNLNERVEAVRTLGDIRRALALQDWNADVGGGDELAVAQRQAFLHLVARFKKEAHRVLKEGSTDARLAVMLMLAEMGPAVRAPEDPKGIARTFAPDLVELVKSDAEPAVKETAVRTLGQIFPSPDVAMLGLNNLLASGNSEERRAAANGLAGLMGTAAQIASKSGTPIALPAEEYRADIVQTVREVVPAASRGLHDADPEVRRLSAEAMSQAAAALSNQVPQPRTGEEADLPSERTRLDEIRTALQPAIDMFHKEIPALGKALNDPDAEVRLLTERTLEELGGAQQRLLRAAAPSSVPPGTPRPEESQGAVHHKGDSFLTLRGTTPFTNLTRVALKLQAGTVPDKVVELVPSLLPALEARLRDPNVKVRLAAVDVLEALGEAATPAVPVLAEALGDPSLFVRWAAARTLGKVGPVEPDLVVPRLARLLFDRDLDVRLAAALALDRIGPAAEAAVPDLIRATTASDAILREAAIHTLRDIGTGARAAVPALAAALSDPNVRVRQTAAEALGRFGSLAASAEPALRKALDDADGDVGRAASDALLNILPTEK
jgi:HEAT repeat protein